jgi:hypothetical protein
MHITEKAIVCELSLNVDDLKKAPYMVKTQRNSSLNHSVP